MLSKKLAASTLTAAVLCAAAPALCQDFAGHWYQGKAEITSYALEQARYGEVHPGRAVLIFVTEDFSRAEQVKLDDPAAAGDDAAKILKLNFTKKFDTGVYPYSMMTSVFSPIEADSLPAALKVTTSSQEWCGHTFTQLNRTADGYRFQGHSYFESEGEQEVALPAAILEDELWTTLRLDPARLPTGELSVVPGTMFLRLRHVDPGPRAATASLSAAEGDPGIQVYTLTYPELGRTLSIRFRAAFPYEIEGWEETSASGFGRGARQLTTRAEKISRMMLDYWNRHDLADAPLRQELGLE